MSGKAYQQNVEQKVIVCKNDYDRELNDHLDDGWRIVSVTGAGSGAGSEGIYDHAVYFLVVLEKPR